MKKIHVAAVALILASAAVAGLVAATRTAGVGRTTQTTDAATTMIMARSHRLDQVQAALRRALKDRPPALPRLLHVKQRAAGGNATTIIYRRPAPIVVVRHGAHPGESDSAEHDGGGESD